VQSCCTCLAIVNHYYKSGNTVNVCALDLSKAFDKFNNRVLFLKLMKTPQIPEKLLSVRVSLGV